MTYASQDTAVANAINNANAGPVWAVQGVGTSDSSTIYLFARTAGVAGNAFLISNNLANGGYYNGAVTASNLVAGVSTFSLTGGGQTWAVATEATATGGYDLTLTGADRGANYGITIQDPNALLGVADVATNNYNPTPANWTETAGTGSGSWNGADILTQSDAQLALGQIDAAVTRQDQVRASLGSVENRLNGTIQNLQVQTENLQASQSRISDVDVATEMTNFTTQSILTQAATAMLAQANALPRLALTLLGGGGGAI
jgi:flagellin